MDTSHVTPQLRQPISVFVCITLIRDRRLLPSPAIFACPAQALQAPFDTGSADMQWRWSTGALPISRLRGLIKGNCSISKLEDQLFKVERLVDANPDLRRTLGDRRTPVDARADLLGGLIDGRVLPTVARLARRAVAARLRTFDLTVEGYLLACSGTASAGQPPVTVAHPLTEEQESRIRVRPCPAKPAVTSTCV